MIKCCWYAIVIYVSRGVKIPYLKKKASGLAYMAGCYHDSRCGMTDWPSSNVYCNKKLKTRAEGSIMAVLATLKRPIPKWIVCIRLSVWKQLAIISAAVVGHEQQPGQPRESV